MLEIVFWASVAIIVYTYFGFPLLLFVRSRWFRRPPKCADITPHVTLLIAAYNEAAVIGSRLDNILELDYPRDRLTVLVASDGSDDGTNEIVTRYAQRGIRLLALPRGGKIAALNAAAAHLEGDILVFSDANTMCVPDALRLLVRPFADPHVGGVAGHQLYASTKTASSAEFGERAYWSFDQALWEWQSAAGNLTACTGGLYAIRRELFSPVPAGVADDGLIWFRTMALGYRMIYEPRALAVECVASSAEVEYRRKVRVIALGMRSLWTVRQLLNPWRYGFSSLQLFSHKVLRWMTPWPLMSLLFSSLILAHSSRFYAAAFAVQAGFYAVALAFAFVPQPTLRRLAVPGALTLPFYFCLTYTASTWAQLLLLCGRRWDRWDATHTIRFPLRAKRSKVAYIMSRFPKITETFVLYEILEHRRRGDAVEVYPLMREHQSVAHPDVERLLDCVHFLPFYSPAIVRANWYYLRHSPRAYLGTVAEAVRGNFGSTRLLLGALAFLPKSVAFAFEMERSGVTHVHAHFATHPALSAWIIHRLTGIPFSFTAHAHDVFGDRQMLREKLTSAAFAVTISEHNREFMARECGEDIRRKIHVIHCGVDVGYFTPPTVRTQSGPLRILCLASLWEVKGHTYLIEACRLLRQRGIAFHCHFIGDGECRAQLVEQISRVGLQDAFTFLGPQPRSVVRRMLHDAQVKVLACVPLPDGVRDGIPVALMEAIACGLPVISTVLSGIPELVDNGVSGILVAPRDPLALAEALERLACDPELRLRMGRYGRDKVMREFNLAANAEKLAALFAEPAVGDPVARSA